MNKYLSQVISSNVSSNEELSNYVLEPWIPFLNAEVEGNGPFGCKIKPTEVNIGFPALFQNWI